MPKAIALLRQFRVLRHPTDALDYLRDRFTSYRLLSLYHHFFPEEFANSQASPYPPIDQDEILYTPKEWEFLTLVNECLFPLPYLDFEEYEYSPNSPNEILVTPLGLGWLDDEGVESLRRGFRVLFPFTELGRNYLEEYDQFGEEWYQEEFESPISFADIAHTHTVNSKQFRHLCHEQGKPLKFAPLTLKLIDLSTRNVWLDESGGWINSYCGTTLTWSKQNVNYLTRKHRQAERIIDAVMEFVNWLEQDLTPRLFQILQLWNSASSTHKPSPR
ncbi:MAG: hypothetical protein F6K58_08495 [Symploca sp. SIO2E9]|nr:hypothetical protein [Symploca sp. SIO2E9]